MSNRRRKTVGAQKLRRNLLIRQARGAAKRGDAAWQGNGRQYRAPEGWVLSPTLEQRGQKLNDEMNELVLPYWRGASLDHQ